MPRLRSRSINVVSMRNTRSAVRKYTTVSQDATVNTAAPHQTQPLRSILKQSNCPVNTRRTRSSITRKTSNLPIPEPVKEERRTVNRRPASLPKEKESTASIQTETNKAVPRRKRSTDPLKPKTTPDPYAFDALVDSDDEKENIDPKGSVRRAAKLPLATNKSEFQHRGKARKVREPVAKPVAPIFTTSVAALTGRPSVHFGPSTRIGSGSTSNRPSAGSSLAELERQKSASATILLSLPRNQPTMRTSSVLSVSALVSTHALSASTPATQVATTSAHVVNGAALPSSKLVLSPLNTVPLTSAPVVPEAPFHQVTEDTHPDDSAFHPAASSSHSHSEDKDEHTGSSRDRSSDSKSGGSHHRRRKMSESEREEAYHSWLDEFNAELEKFESHELTVLEDKSSTSMS